MFKLVLPSVFQKCKKLRLLEALGFAQEDICSFGIKDGMGERISFGCVVGRTKVMKELGKVRILRTLKRDIGVD